jgi:aspartate carbamoyltransferase catalytic subunit
MNNWNHNHILDLSTFSLDDYKTVLELTTRFKDIHKSSSRKLPALQGKLITNLFFEPSTRTRSSFELAAKRLSADIQNFSVSTSSLSKGETPLDTILTYISMGADILVIRHESANVPADLAHYVDTNNINTSILSAGDGYHSHPSQGLLDLFTLASFFNPQKASANSLINKQITIVGDILHSRVARSNLWALTACGADITLCGPPSLLPDEFNDFVLNPPPGQKVDPVNKRGKVYIKRSLKDALRNADAVMTLRLQKERMQQNMITDLDNYHKEYGITHQSLKWCEKKVPVLHPGPVNRGIEISSKLVEDNSINLISNQVENGIPTRMALLYLLGLNKNK